MAKEVNGIPSHKGWTEIRDERGGKSNMCSKVNLGKLLDAYWNEGSNPAKRLAALDALHKGFLTYNMEKAVKANKELFKATLKIQEFVDREMTAIRANKDIGLAIGTSAVDGLKRCQSLASKPDANVYGKMWDGIGRGLGKILPSAGNLAPLREEWVKVHASVATRTDVDSEQDPAAKDKKILDGAAKYKAGIAALLEKAKELGIEVKLH